MGVFDFGSEEQKQSSADDVSLGDKLTQIVHESGIVVENIALVESEGIVSIGGEVSSKDEADKLVDMLNAAEGVKSVESALKVKGGNVHVVVAGDTLWGLAEKYYGDGSKYMKIFEANKEVWKNYNYDPNQIYVGWELVIP